MWNQQQINDHKEAAKRLLKIKDLAFEYLRKNKNSTELETQKYITRLMKEKKLTTNFSELIVAFGPSSAKPHYRPGHDGNRRLRVGDVIKIDVWARLDKKSAPYADITWMGYNGPKIPKNVQEIFDIVISARDEGVKFIKKKLKTGELPTGKEIDKIVRYYIHHYGHGEKFIHGTGHSLGFLGPHGARTRINKKGRSKIRKNVAYTIEPGIYIEKKFGVRSEIDFYVSNRNEFVLTAGIQRKIITV